MQEVLFPPLSDYQYQVPKDGEYNDADEKKILLKEADALRFLLYHSSFCLQNVFIMSSNISVYGIGANMLPEHGNNILNMCGGSKTHEQGDLGLTKELVVAGNHRQL